VSASFKDDEYDDPPTPRRVKRNLESMRKAAFSGVPAPKFNGCRKSHAADKAKRAMSATGKRKEREQDTAMNAKVEADSAAKVKVAEPNGSKLGKTAKAQRAIDKLQKDKRKVVAKKAPVKQQSKATEKPKKAKKAKTDKTLKDDAIADDAESCDERKFSAEILKKAEALAAALPRGITIRPSGKWQVQLYYAGKSRYIGVFLSRLDAAVAYELARECYSKFKDDDVSPEQAKKNVALMRKAAFSFTKGSIKRQKTDTSAMSEAPKSKKQKKNVAVPVLLKTDAAVSTTKKQKTDIHPAELKTTKSNAQQHNDQTMQFAYGQEQHQVPMQMANSIVEVEAEARLGDAASKAAESKGPMQQLAVTSPSKPDSFGNLISADHQRGTIKELDDIGPGWKVSIVPRKSDAKHRDYYYFSPTGQRFRSYKEAKTYAEELYSTDESLGVGAIGYKFRKQWPVTTENGAEEWFDGEVVDIVAGSGR